jgi:Na+-transporting methylmalonyl-CoA/oxaloacetate decarboxylase gamma subunit
MSQILQSLLITAIGMGLVFILIILLWGFMAALVALGNRWDFMANLQGNEEENVAGEETPETGEPAFGKSNIVAIAVAIALARGERILHLLPPSSSNASAWQAVTRANALAQISSISNRKPRG